MTYEKRVLKELLPYYKNMPKMDLNNDLDKFRQNPMITAADMSMTSVQWHTVCHNGLSVQVKSYMQRNVSTDDKLPALLWIHGGGYVLGHPDINDALCQKFVIDAGCRVFSVDYRLAPENRYPAAVEDCYAALCWLSGNSEQFGINPDKIAVAGASAGGGLAAAITLMARDRKGPTIAFQMPLYPMLDDRNNLPSSLEINQETMTNAWNLEKNEIAWGMYLGDLKGQTPVYAAPAREKNLTGLPPAFISIGQLDPFRDESIQYVTRLAQAGVDVEFHLYPGCYHGFDALFIDTPVSQKARNEYIDALRRAFQ